MELQTPLERFEEANKEMSRHCFETGRLRYVIEMDEQSLEKRKLEYANMRVDFDKLNKELQRATTEWQKAEAAKPKEMPEALN